MDSHAQTLLRRAGARSAGPQGTQLFSAEELRHHATEARFMTEAQASVREPVLEGVSAGLEGRRSSLRAGRQTIGRAEYNNIVVDDLSVSASHAWIVNQQGQYVIMNTLSTNGTFVNDKRIHEAPLKHGDRVRLGQAEFVFLTRERGMSRLARLGWLTGGVLMLTGLGGLAWWLI